VPRELAQDGIIGPGSPPLEAARATPFQASTSLHVLPKLVIGNLSDHRVRRDLQRHQRRPTSGFAHCHCAGMARFLNRADKDVYIIPKGIQIPNKPLLGKAIESAVDKSGYSTLIDSEEFPGLDLGEPQILDGLANHIS
jgi:hypothetical protein